MIKRLLTGSCMLAICTSLAAQQPYQMPRMGYQPTMPPPMSAPPARPPQARPRTEFEEASMILKAGLTRLINFFNTPTPPSREQIAVFLEKDIAPYFDFAYMSQWAAGPAFNRINDQQKKALETDIKAQFLSTMAQKLSNFSQQTVSYLSPRMTGRNQVELSISIGNPGNYPARLDFRLYKAAAGWKVFDVSANGSSALMYYRQYYRQKLQQQMMQTRYRR